VVEKKKASGDSFGAESPSSVAICGYESRDLTAVASLEKGSSSLRRVLNEYVATTHARAEDQIRSISPVRSLSVRLAVSLGRFAEDPLLDTYVELRLD
jgi:hypothetical protein